MNEMETTIHVTTAMLLLLELDEQERWSSGLAVQETLTTVKKGKLTILELLNGIRQHKTRYIVTQKNSARETPTSPISNGRCCEITTKLKMRSLVGSRNTKERSTPKVDLSRLSTEQQLLRRVRTTLVVSPT